MANYKAELAERIEVIRKDTKAGVLSREERLEIAEEIAGEYAYKYAESVEILTERERLRAEKEGRKPRELPFNPPDSTLLNLLADLLLHEELYDDTPWKVRNTEYPVFSETLYDVKTKRDTNISAAEKEQERKSIGFRRRRTRYENTLTDRKVKSHNKALRKRYLDFVNGKTEGVINVAINE